MAYSRGWLSRTLVPDLAYHLFLYNWKTKNFFPTILRGYKRNPSKRIICDRDSTWLTKPKKILLFTEKVCRSCGIPPKFLALWPSLLWCFSSFKLLLPTSGAWVVIFLGMKIPPMISLNRQWSVLGSSALALLTHINNDHRPLSCWPGLQPWNLPWHNTPGSYCQ